MNSNVNTGIPVRILDMVDGYGKVPCFKCENTRTDMIYYSKTIIDTHSKFPVSI